MNIDRSLVARALAKAGEEPITDEEWNEGTSSRVRIVKEFYLAILQDSLSSYDWTSQKKRARLTPMDNYEYEEVLSPKQSDLAKYYVYDSEDDKYYKAENYDPSETYYLQIEVNLTGYAFMYPLPADCVKVVKLENDEPYIVEGAFIYADVQNVVLLYIRNYFTGKYVYEKVAEPNPDDIDKYFVIDEEGDYVKATSYVMGTEYYVIKEEDYNFYSEPNLDPTLSSYFECRLAACLALKLTGDTNKYQMLFNEAQIIGQNAQKKSAEMSRNRAKGNPTWVEQLGLE